MMEEDKRSKTVQKSYFDVLGLCCSSEVPLIENILKSLDGVKEVNVVVTTRTVIVLHDNLCVSQLQIVKALNDARLEANIRVEGENNFKKKWPSPYAMVCGVLLLLSFLKYAYKPLGWLALGAVAIGVIPICLKAIASLKNLRLDINILAIIAVIGTIALGDYVEAGTIVFLFTVAEWLESRASYKANAAMTSLMSMVPQKAVIAETGEVVAAEEVKLNTVLAVKAGEVIPIDGVVVEGNCEVDEKTLTGESFPVAKQKDSIVWAGTINLNGYISVKTTSLAEDCVVAKMATLVEEAQNSKSKTQRLIDQCAKFYTPVVIIISILVAVIPVALGLGNLKKWLRLALVIMVSACPCALILSTPVATFCALTKAAKSGLLVKRSDYLEILSKIKILAFDKTGTITKGEFTVTDFETTRDDISSEDLLYWVSSIESKSSHPMAAALVEYGKSHSIEPKPENVEDFQNFPGEGIFGKIEGKNVYIGNKKISARASCETAPTLEGNIKNGKSVGYIYCGGLVGTFSLADTCRFGVEEAIKELKSLGIKTAMLTGDSHVAAMYTHQQVGNAIEVIHAELLPEDKAKLIMEFKKEGPTAMVGDGINDAPALATADIGISMGISGSALATESGHMILMSNDMRNVSKAIKLSKKATRKVIQNIVLSIATKIAILALAIAGHPLVWAAVLADVGTCILVILNSMLLLREPHSHHGAKCCKSTSSTSHVHKHKSSDDHKNKKCCPVSHSSSAETLSSSHCNGKKCHDSDNLLSEKSCETRNCHKRSCKGTNHGTNHHDYSEERQKFSDDHRLSKCCPESHASSAETLSSSQCNGKEFHESANSHTKKSCEARHCHERSCEETNRDHLESRTTHDTDHHHSKKCNHHSESSFRDENQVRNSETHCCSKRNGDPVDYVIIDVTHVNGNHVESGTVDRTKQETGGCCERHVTKCCNSNHGNHGDGLKALSEVVIEH